MMKLRGLFTGLLALAVAAPVIATVRFSDIPEDHPLRSSVLWAQGQGLIEGRDDGTFHPDQPVSRKEFQTITDRGWASNVQPEGWTRAEATLFWEAGVKAVDTHRTLHPTTTTTMASERPTGGSLAERPVVAPGGAKGYGLVPPDRWPQNITFEHTPWHDAETSEFVVTTLLHGWDDLREVRVSSKYEVRWWEDGPLIYQPETTVKPQSVTSIRTITNIWVKQQGVNEVRVPCELEGKNLYAYARVNAHQPIPPSETGGVNGLFKFPRRDYVNQFTIDCGNAKADRPPADWFYPLECPEDNQKVEAAWPDFPPIEDIKPQFFIVGEGRWRTVEIRTNYPGLAGLAKNAGGHCRPIYFGSFSMFQPKGWEPLSNPPDPLPVVAGRTDNMVRTQRGWIGLFECHPYQNGRTIVAAIDFWGPDHVHEGDTLWMVPSDPLDCPPNEPDLPPDPAVQITAVFDAPTGDFTLTWERPGWERHGWQYRLRTNITGCHPAQSGWNVKGTYGFNFYLEDYNRVERPGGRDRGRLGDCFYHHQVASARWWVEIEWAGGPTFETGRCPFPTAQSPTITCQTTTERV